MEEADKDWEMIRMVGDEYFSGTGSPVATTFGTKIAINCLCVHDSD